MEKAMAIIDITSYLINELERKCISPDPKKKYLSIISIESFNEFKLNMLNPKIIIPGVERDISGIKKYKNIYFDLTYYITNFRRLENKFNTCGFIVDSAYKEIEELRGIIYTDTLYIPCDEFKEIIRKEKIQDNIITMASEFSIRKFGGKEYYRIWWD